MKQIKLKTRDEVIMKVKRSVLKHSSVLLARLEAMEKTPDQDGQKVDFIVVPEADESHLQLLMDWMAHRIGKGVSLDCGSSDIPNNQEHNGVEQNPSEQIWGDWDETYFVEHHEHAFLLISVATALKMNIFVKVWSRRLFDWIRNKSHREVEEMICSYKGTASRFLNYDSSSMDMEMDFCD
ncbi:hypothetical protein ZHAS_00003351 [Anopheles sinensis]|uniref:SKP1 component POZ domain-containing protein n=1 Tax=Anopheles sinensis TaxID=74873 RepID=A0A084VE44_ANOSI|nr:hypothetical protein ZHAS_00003351 [Anopheles sinensis]